MSPDALIEALSSIEETTKLGAVIYRNAAGEYHRTAGPAVVSHTGEQHWYQNGVLHREDGPAIVYPDGNQRWYRNGRLHRTDGPAVVRADGSKVWYQQGLLHRTDGPALIRADGTEAWYVRGSFMPYTLVQHLATLGDVHDT